jgi:putative tricarboxylic transport membrane protein
MTLQLSRPFILLVLASTVVLCSAARSMAAAAAAESPLSGPVKFVVHVNPGSGADVFARFIAEIIRRERLLPAGVEVLNRGGASGAVAINYMAQRKADPTHLLSVTSFIVATPLRNKELPSYKEFPPVATMAIDTNGIFVLASGPHRTVKDLIDAARRKPKSVTSAFGVWGGTNHIIAHQLGKTTGVEFAYVIFKGGSEASAALLGGHVDFTSDNPSEVRGHVEAGRLRALAVVGERRLPVFPEVPTLKELGYNLGPILPTFRGFVAAPGVSREVVDAYAALLRKVTETAAWKRYIVDNALEEEFRGPAEMATFLDHITDVYVRFNAEVGQQKK